MKNTLVSVAIVTFNRVLEVERALNSVYKQSYSPIEVIVLDNASCDETVLMIKEKFPKVKLIKSSLNFGCPKGRNIAAENCSGEIIYFLDDDAWIESNVLEELVSGFIDDDLVAVMMPNILEYYGQEKFYRYSAKNKMRLMTFSGGVSAIKRSIFKEIGPFPDTKYGAEENYLAIKLFAKNYKIVLIPNLIAHHKPSIVRNIKEVLYLRVRNDIIWVWTFTPRLILPFLLSWKLIIWLKYGMKNNSIIPIAKALLNGIFIYGFSFGKDRFKVKYSVFIGYLLNRKKVLKVIKQHL
ncbi:MAG: glycosyltransferase [Candidatus Marinimicrobia bacterium]|nr:glycosyltransferase [Candidatus Neomarinimicrobiota bacterium]MBT4851024.1 glycosyltransferase [Candidatus Neomarinimicrobiota bacterium]MBT6713620.1 glycosyltransferase [Candidatus Neomarinimicrobiota bacterium]MBT7021621.1 glycosyltransferase [Candidatus Neomarinimicrobiota bacterium]